MKQNIEKLWMSIRTVVIVCISIACFTWALRGEVDRYRPVNNANITITPYEVEQLRKHMEESPKDLLIQGKLNTLVKINQNIILTEIQSMKKALSKMTRELIKLQLIPPEKYSRGDRYGNNGYQRERKDPGYQKEKADDS